MPAFKATPRPLSAPFDFVRGEVIGDLGHDYVVTPAHRWADTPVLGLAMERAKTALNGYRLSDVQAELLVQEYHRDDKLVVVVAVWGKAPGKATWQWHYVTTALEVKGPTKAALVLAGRWKVSAKH